MFYYRCIVPSLSRHMAHSVSGGTSTSGASGLAGKSTGYWWKTWGCSVANVRVERTNIVDHGNVDTYILYKHKKESYNQEVLTIRKIYHPLHLKEHQIILQCFKYLPVFLMKSPLQHQDWMLRNTAIPFTSLFKDNLSTIYCNSRSFPPRN